MGLLTKDECFLYIPNFTKKRFITFLENLNIELFSSLLLKKKKEKFKEYDAAFRIVDGKMEYEIIKNNFYDTYDFGESRSIINRFKGFSRDCRVKEKNKELLVYIDNAVSGFYLSSFELEVLIEMLSKQNQLNAIFIECQEVSSQGFWGLKIYSNGKEIDRWEIDNYIEDEEKKELIERDKVVANLNGWVKDEAIKDKDLPNLLSKYFELIDYNKMVDFFNKESRKKYDDLYGFVSLLAFKVPYNYMHKYTFYRFERYSLLSFRAYLLNLFRRRQHRKLIDNIQEIENQI